MKQVNQRLAYGKGWENTPIPLLRRGGRQFPSRKRGDCDSNRGVVDGVVADTPLKEGNEHPHPFPPPSEGEDEGGGDR